MDGVIDLVQPTVGMTDDALYEYDFPAWCELQAERLRRLAQTAKGDDLPDWPRVIEEMEDMGAAERHRVEGLLVQAFVHLLTLRADPRGRDAKHWISETRAFLLAARRAYAPSMQQRLDLAGLWNDALFQIEGRRLGEKCPLALGDLLSASPDISALTAQVR